MQTWHQVVVENTCDDGEKQIGRKGAHVAQMYKNEEE